MAIGDVLRAMGATHSGGINPPARQRLRPTEVPVVVNHDGVTSQEHARRIAEAVHNRIVVEPALPDPIVIPRSKPILDIRHITKLVAKTDAAPQISRSGGNRDKYLHASSLIGCCEREHCISQQHGLPTATTVSGPMRLIWEIGRAVEKHIRNGVIAARDYHGVYGNWRCACEAVSYVGEYVRDRTCHRCNRAANRYFEPVLSNDFMRVIGSPDLTLIEQGYFMPIEIKSMNKEEFDKLEAPKADHAIQGCIYRWLYEQMGKPVMDIVPVVYGRKDFKFGGTFSVYKEFHVPYSDWAGQVENAMLTGQRIAAHNEGGTLPPRTICSSPTSPRAKDCQRASLCWNL